MIPITMPTTNTARAMVPNTKPTTESSQVFVVPTLSYMKTKRHLKAVQGSGALHNVTRPTDWRRVNFFGAAYKAAAAMSPQVPAFYVNEDPSRKGNEGYINREIKALTREDQGENYGYSAVEELAAGC